MDGDEGEPVQWDWTYRTPRPSWSWHRTRVGAGLGLLLMLTLTGSTLVHEYGLASDGRKVDAVMLSQNGYGRDRTCDFAYVVAGLRYVHHQAGAPCDPYPVGARLPVHYWADHPGVADIRSGGAALGGEAVAAAVAAWAGVVVWNGLLGPLWEQAIGSVTQPRRRLSSAVPSGTPSPVQASHPGPAE